MEANHKMAKQSSRRRRTKNSLYVRWIIWSLVLMVVFLTGMVVYLRSELSDAEERYEQLRETRLVEASSKKKAEDSSEEQYVKSDVDMDSTEEPSTPVSSSRVTAVGKPKQRTEREVIDELETLGKSHPVIDDIFKNSEEYPDNLLEALANNPEMADYVAGWKENVSLKSTTVDVGLTKAEQLQEFPLFLQWDSRWGYHSYGDDSVIGLSGCGPTCVSMMLYYLTGNEKLTPDVIADYSMEHEYYVRGTGTSWALMTEIGREYGVHSQVLSLSESVMKNVLDADGVIICAMRPGDFTAVGHFIVIYGYGEDGFYVNDPNCIMRSKKHWSYDELSGQIKNLWGYTR